MLFLSSFPHQQSIACRTRRTVAIFVIIQVSLRCDFFQAPVIPHSNHFVDCIVAINRSNKSKNTQSFHSFQFVISPLENCFTFVRPLVFFPILIYSFERSKQKRLGYGKIYICNRWCYIIIR